MFLKCFKFFFFFLLFVNYCPLYANFIFTPQLKEVYHDLLKLKLRSARPQLKSNLATEKENGIRILLDNYADIIELLVTEDRILYTQLAENEWERLKKIKNLNDRSPYFLFVQAEIRLQWSVVKLKFGDETGAFFDLQKSYKLLEENRRKYPDFLPQKKSLGLIHILIGSVPDKYHWLISLFGMKGNIAQGINEMEEVAARDDIYNLESTLLLEVVNGYILKNENNQLNFLKKLYETNPDNLLICFLYASIAHKSGESEIALPLLHNCPKGSEYVNFYFLDYLKGDIYLRKLNFQNSIFFFEKFLKNTKGENFLKDSYYKLLLARWLDGKSFNSLAIYIKKIKTNGRELTEVDKYAQNFAEANLEPDKILMKCRLLFDGGYYGRAFEIFATVNENTFHNMKYKAEYNYRKARLLHKTNDSSGAIIFYLKAITLSEADHFYFGAASALQTGYIYKDEKQYAKARHYFAKALSFKNHEYKNSIDSKARNELEKLNGVK